ncbi:exodeoxyribonuclease-3 [Desulfonatronum thiosulfatophilum]|uniref:Exodeoxyribonuclease-3 n=1 Tax=Desulfonatronum thiosulfatophilum TaxID=617002 RepID=A0A1G6BQY7_9BACT|nr:exodeoxyribonuclease III [Desulfonatronum thiosulfatophilum]SDB23021.1 exodeoxyribonuclease-3 [Desulfonatronum thiosulfatophilum]
MILYSWNVNGFRAVLNKGYWEWFRQVDADVVGLQEVKIQQDQLAEESCKAPGYQDYWNCCQVKKGYSGVACYTRNHPLSVALDLPLAPFQDEGRVIQLEFPKFYYFNVYFPNGQMSQARLDYKLGFYDAFLTYAQNLRQTKPIVVCGDFNTAHKEIDLKNPQANAATSGFLPIERAWMDKFIDSGYVDTFRMFNDQPGQYTWWTYRFGARSRNAGWRIDYFFVSRELVPAVRRAWIEPEVMGSDHCPVGLELEVERP